MSKSQAPSPNKKKIGWVSPFPPVRSGISVYSEVLLKELKKSVEFDFFPVSATRNGNGIYIDLVRNGDFDLLIYSLGNHPLHLPSYEKALKEPGIVFLHDLNLHDLLYYRSIQHKEPFLYLKYLLNETDDFQKIKQLLNNQGKDRNLFVDFPLLREIALSNNHFIVHSEYAKNLITEINPEAKVLKINHICPWVEKVDRLKKEKITVGIFGYLSKDRMIEETLQVFKKFQNGSTRQIILRIVGEDVDIDLKKIIEKQNLEQYCEIFKEVDDEKFLKLMKECDYAINIRYPVRGEMSGNLIKFLGFGIPTAIIREKSFEDIPKDCVFSIDINNFEVSLMNFFDKIEKDDLSLEKISEKAYEFAKNQCSIEKGSLQILDFIKQYKKGEPKRSLKKLKLKDLVKFYDPKNLIKGYIKKFHL
ncbi:MAG: glycosyltransferase [candidate division WOR-3 bacterium]